MTPKNKPRPGKIINGATIAPSVRSLNGLTGTTAHDNNRSRETPRDQDKGLQPLAGQFEYRSVDHLAGLVEFEDADVVLVVLFGDAGRDVCPLLREIHAVDEPSEVLFPL